MLWRVSYLGISRGLAWGALYWISKKIIAISGWQKVSTHCIHLQTKTLDISLMVIFQSFNRSIHLIFCFFLNTAQTDQRYSLQSGVHCSRSWSLHPCCGFQFNCRALGLQCYWRGEYTSPVYHSGNFSWIFCV